MITSTRPRALLEAIAAERRKGKIIGGAIFLSILAIVLAFGFASYRKVTTFDSATFTAHLERHGTTTVWPLVSQELDGIARESGPVLEKAFVAETERLGAGLTDKLASESEVFQRNMNDTMKRSLEHQFRLAAARHKDELGAKAPSFVKDDAAYLELMTRLESNARGWAQVQLDSTFKQHVGVLQSINESMQSLQAQADAQRMKNPTERTPDEVMILFLDILNSRLVEG